MKVAVDIDGTIADTAVAVRAELRERLSLPDLPLRTSMAGLYNDIPPDHLLTARAVLRQTFDRTGDAYRNAEPIPDAVDCVNLLSDEGRLAAYITYRPSRFRDDTRVWLMRHGFPYAPICHVGRSDTKVAHMHEHDATVLVDDDYGTTLDAEKAGFAGIHMLFGETCDDMPRHHNWASGWLPVMTLLGVTS